MAPRFILYAFPDWLPSGRRIRIYLDEKKISPSHVYVVQSPEDAEAKGYPPKQGNFTPIMAVSDPDDPSGYSWIEQSSAMLEMLEDYCDANPDVSSVPSLRGSDPIYQRARIRGILHWADSTFDLFAVHAFLGNEVVAGAHKMTPNQTAAEDIERYLQWKVLEPLDKVIPQVVNFEGIAEGKEGAMSIADIALLCSWEYCAQLCGKDPLASGKFPNFSRFIDACKSRNILAKGDFPPVVKSFWSAWVDEKKEA